MGALLALIPTKDMVYGALIVMLAAFGIYERHHLIAEGQQHELAALKASSDRLEKQTATQTAELKAKATMAEQAYDKEANSLANIAAQPAPVVRVCKYGSGPIVPAAGAAQPGNEAASAVATALQPVSEGNPSSAGPDIGPMLKALAERADQVSAALREYQHRG